MCQAQRWKVAGPIWFAMPRSSPAGQGGAGTFRRWMLAGSSAARAEAANANSRIAFRLVPIVVV